MAEEKRTAGSITTLKAEFAKIFWPDKKSTAKQTIAVLVVSAVVGVLIVVLDSIIQFGLDKLLML